MKKKILVLSSSPRKGGNSDLLCDQFKLGAQKAGHYVEKIFLKDKKINYCTGCGTCIERNKRCPQKDDMAEVLEKMIASQTLSEYKVMLGGALNAGVTPVEVKEIVYQAVPYLGIAKVFDFIHATNEILVSSGIKLLLEGQSTTSPETRYEKGLEVQKSIFGEVIDKMYEDSPKNQLHIQKYICKLFW